MAETSISIPVDSEIARTYSAATAEDKKKVRLLVGLWLRDLLVSSRPLGEIMDEASRTAEQRGLRPEILESLLNDE